MTYDRNFHSLRASGQGTVAFGYLRERLFEQRVE
jgi:hypothetical protein